jgi:hypothetical protein
MSATSTTDVLVVQSDNEEEVEKVIALKKNKWARYCVAKHAFNLPPISKPSNTILRATRATGASLLPPGSELIFELLKSLLLPGGKLRTCFKDAE